MQFSTPIPIAKSNFLIDYNSKIMSMGSCFAENIAEKFDYFKFENAANPFGIVFNAVSIERLISRIVSQKLFTEKDIFYHNELWHCFEVHSNLSNPDKAIFLKNLNQIIKLSHLQMLECSHFIITLGTSWVYRNIENDEIVANCHKIPQKHFTKVLLSIETTQKSIANIIALIHSINKNLKFIFTISPVRHIKDGFIENNISKAILLQAVYQLSQTVNCKLHTEYFPSYEIILDELRDYRFYKPDMLHPNQIAIDYVWEKFVQSAITESSLPIMQEVENIQKMISHKSSNIYSIQNQVFKLKVQEKINQLRLKNPHIIF